MDKIKPSEVSEVLLQQLQGISQGQNFDEASLNKGVVTYETAQGKKDLEVIGGFVSVNQNQVNLCVEL